MERAKILSASDNRRGVDPSLLRDRGWRVTQHRTERPLSERLGGLQEYLITLLSTVTLAINNRRDFESAYEALDILKYVDEALATDLYVDPGKLPEITEPAKKQLGWLLVKENRRMGHKWFVGVIPNLQDLEDRLADAEAASWLLELGLNGEQVTQIAQLYSLDFIGEALDYIEQAVDVLMNLDNFPTEEKARRHLFMTLVGLVLTNQDLSPEKFAAEIKKALEFGNLPYPKDFGEDESWAVAPEYEDEDFKAVVQTAFGILQALFLH